MSVLEQIMTPTARLADEHARLVMAPSGRLSIVVVQDDATEQSHVDAISDNSAVKRSLQQAFATGVGAGLFELTTCKESLSSAAAYWREFAARFMTALCHSPLSETQQLSGAISPPTPAELDSLVLTVPPMYGAEYISSEVLSQVWRELDEWVRREVAATQGGLGEFLQHRAPMWHQLGRICFHLAENKRDPNRPFAFLATYTSGLSQSHRVQHQPLGGALREFAGAKNRAGLVKLLSPVELAAQRSPLIRELVDSGEIYQPLAWTPAEAYRFLQDAPILDQCGVMIRLPDWWQQRPRPTVNVSIGGQKKKSSDGLGLLEFQINVALGDETLTDAEWRELMKADEGLALLRGQWVEVDPIRLREALDHWRAVEREVGRDGLSFVEGMRLLAGAPRDLASNDDQPTTIRPWQFVSAGDWLGDTLQKLRDPTALAETYPGKDLLATLRGYQQTGVNWLWFVTSLGLGACLADDMGLGKTIQVISLLLILKRQKVDRPSIAVLPASLLGNWKSELERFAPSLRAAIVHPSEATVEQLAAWETRPESTAEYDLILTTYGMLPRQPWLTRLPWHLAILDEAQAIKNPAAKQTSSVKQLTSRARIAMTGTPVENRLGDLWSLFDFLCPGLLGNTKQFNNFAKRLGNEGVGRFAPLRSLVQPYILRRMKTDRRVIDDLPDKTEVKAFCSLSKKQAVLYAKLVDELGEILKQAKGIQRRGIVLSYLMKFKQVCNHPSHLLGRDKFDPAESGKFERLKELGEEISARQERMLVFTQFREMTEPLAAFLQTIFGRSGLVLHGGTAVGKRKKLVDHFQRDDGPPFFILSLKAGGTGLNLTAASHVIHFDRWWNPAVENQATDRAFRIGQRKNVLVQKFVCRGTMEERIDSLIEEKTGLANDLIQGGAEVLLTEMNDQDLISLVSLDIERAI